MDISTIAIILLVLLAISEALSLIPSLSSNGIFQVIYRVIKLLAGEIKVNDTKKEVRK